jgi:hypothetical protein
LKLHGNSIKFTCVQSNLHILILHGS